MLHHLSSFDIAITNRTVIRARASAHPGKPAKPEISNAERVAIGDGGNSGGGAGARRVSLSLLCGFTPIVTHLPRPRVRSTRERERRDAATLIVPHVDQLAKQVLNDRDEPAEK